MFTTTKLTVLLSAFCLLGVAAPALPASAATAQDITMTPSSSQLSADPGGTAKGTFSVINQGDSDYTVALSVSPYHVVGDSYDPKFTQLPGTTDPSDWVKLASASKQQLTSRKLINVDYTVNVPAGTPAGGYYAVIFAETTPETTPTSGVVAHNRVGNILYITVNGPVKTAGSVTGSSVPKISFESSIPVGVKIQNTGGIHFPSITNIAITNLFGKQVFSASLQRYVLPQTERLVTTSWSAKAPFGIYQVHRSALVAGQTQTLPTATVFVIQPVVLAGIGLILVLLIGLILRRKVHHQQSSRKEKTNV